MTNLGNLYLRRGQIEEAMKWTRAAAMRGSPTAQFNLSNFLLKYEGEKTEEAIAWLRRSAEQGHKEAECNLGICYYNGESGLPQNDSDAIVWLRRAADQNHSLAQFLLGEIYEHQDKFLQAAVWYKKADGNSASDSAVALRLGCLYWSGVLGETGRDEKAAQYFERAARSSDKEEAALAAAYQEEMRLKLHPAPKLER